MPKYFSFVAACAAVMGVALAAQMEASSDIYLLDVDAARYSGPDGQRFSLQLGDQPRQVTLGAQDEICVQLLSTAGDRSAISAHVRALLPEPHAAAEVKVAGPGISPGTFRSTPWGMLLRVMPEDGTAEENVKRATDAPSCVL
jgi:hypothetical protein